MPQRYFEDFKPGEEWIFDPWVLDDADIVSFARTYDPQVMHTDPEAAMSGPYGGLIASGWQTALRSVTPFLEAVMRQTASLASPGFETFQWLKPVRAGDAITPTVRVLDSRRSGSKPDRGIVRLLFRATDSSDEAVWEAKGIFFISARTSR